MEKDRESGTVAYEALRGTQALERGTREATRHVTPLDRGLVRWLMYTIGNPPVTSTLWNGETPYRPAGKPTGDITFLDRDSLIATVLNPELGFGDGYSAGRITVSGPLVDVLQDVLRSVESSPITRLKRVLPRLRHNTLSNSKKNIHYHYDVGNDFYALWLDPQMSYTCAYYRDAGMSLAQAQTAKMDHVCRKLELRAGQRVVEAGCGWGSLALHMARNYGVSVRAYNISSEQIAYARDRAAREKLADRVEFVEDDYRNISGEYDAFVSVGMLEHVGPENYRALGRVIQRCLRENGRGLIHSIGRNRPKPMNSWTDRRIFPGSHAPSLREMMDIFEGSRLSVLDVENLRLHYATTLRDWLADFEGSSEQVREMYDENFVRAWRLYLASSAAAFLAGILQLFQVVFTHATNNAVPLTREHVYAPPVRAGKPR